MRQLAREPIVELLPRLDIIRKEGFEIRRLVLVRPIPSQRRHDLEIGGITRRHVLAEGTLTAHTAYRQQHRRDEPRKSTSSFKLPVHADIVTISGRITKFSRVSRP